MSSKSSIHKLVDGLDQHQSLLKNFAKRVAVGGEIETAQQTQDLFNDENRQKNAKARKGMMELAQIADKFQGYLEEYRQLDASDDDKMMGLLERINGGKDEGTQHGKTVQKDVAELLGIALSGDNENEDDLEVKECACLMLQLHLECVLHARPLLCQNL